MTYFYAMWCGVAISKKRRSRRPELPARHPHAPLGKQEGVSVVRVPSSHTGGPRFWKKRVAVSSSDGSPKKIKLLTTNS